MNIPSRISGIYPDLIPNITDNFILVATGLFYLAELVEEYTSMSKRVITYMIYVSIVKYQNLHHVAWKTGCSNGSVF